MFSGGAIVLSSAAALSLEGVDATTSGPGEVGRISSLVGGVATPSLKAFLGLMMVRENGRLAALSPEPPPPTLSAVASNPQKALASHPGFASFVAVGFWGGKYGNLWLKGLGSCQGIDGPSHKEGVADRPGDILCAFDSLSTLGTELPFAGYLNFEQNEKRMEWGFKYVSIEASSPPGRGCRDHVHHTCTLHILMMPYLFPSWPQHLFLWCVGYVVLHSRSMVFAGRRSISRSSTRLSSSTPAM